MFQIRNICEAFASLENSLNRHHDEAFAKLGRELVVHADALKAEFSVIIDNIGERLENDVQMAKDQRETIMAQLQ